MRINQPKTWILDLDGTLLFHNGYKNGKDLIIQKSIDFLKTLSKKDYVIILTARKDTYKKQTINFLKKHNIRYNAILFGLPTGKRILINDKKPDGTETAQAFNVDRNIGINI